MDDPNHSLRIKTRWFEATAEGWGMAVLFGLAVLLIAVKALGWL